MNTNYSIGKRTLAFMLSMIMLLSMFPAVSVSAEEGFSAEMNGVAYATLEEALAAVPVGENAPETTIVLQESVTCAFDVGGDNGNASMKVVIDLGGNTLTLAPLVGDEGKRSNGIQVFPNSKLTLKNGKVKCADTAQDGIRVGIANYGILNLDDVVLEAGTGTTYIINNWGRLALSGGTTIKDGTGSTFQYGIINDPYDHLYGDTDVEMNCFAGDVYVESMQVARHVHNTTPSGNIVLNITSGTFGSIVEDGSDDLDVEYIVTGGTIGASDAIELEQALRIVSGGSTIKLYDDVTFCFDVGSEDGSVAKQVTLDLNEHTLTVSPVLGADNSRMSGIRVWMNSGLILKDGQVFCSDNAGTEVGILNNGSLTLENVILKAGKFTTHTIGNRGVLTLRGETIVGNGTGSAFQSAITNAVHELPAGVKDTVLNVSDSATTVGIIQLERKTNPAGNTGNIVLNICGGFFDTITDDSGTDVGISKNITGGVFANDVSAYVKEGFECVLNENGTYQVQFDKLEQAPLIFEKETVVVTFDEGLTVENPISGGSTGGKITFETENDCVSVDTDTGIVTVLKSGTAVIRATMSGNDTYEKVIAEYVLTVEPSDREASFVRNAETVFYGTVSINCPELIVSAGTGEVTYKVLDGANIAVVDSDGKLTFCNGGVGTVTVQATVAADDNYNSCTAEYTVNVEYLPLPENPYICEGTAGDNGWYLGDVILSAPGYTLSESNSFSGEWKDSFTCALEGENTYTIYLKDENGFISGAVEIPVKIDRESPRNLSMTYGEYTWIDELKNILGHSKNVDVYFHFTEATSGVAKVAYSLDNGETYLEASYTNGEYYTSIAPEFRGHVCFYVVDQAGRETHCDQNGTLLVVDNSKPGISVGYKGKYDEEVDSSKRTVITTDGEIFEITFTVYDENLDLQEAVPELIVTDKYGMIVKWDVLWEDTTFDGKNARRTTMHLTDEGVYDILLIGSDRTHETSVQLRVIVDRTPPEMKVVEKTEPVCTDDGKFYYADGGITLELMIREEHFKSERAFVEIMHNGKMIDPAEYGISLQDEWMNPIGFDHSMKMTVGQDADEGIYSVRINYIDGVGSNQVIAGSELFEFVIDKSDPEAAIIYHENGKNLIAWLGEQFGFGQEKIDVTINATDSISGIQYLVYDIGDGEKHQVNADMMDGDTYTFTIEDEYRDKVMVSVYDMANHNVDVTSKETVVIDKTEATIGVGNRGSAISTTTNDGVKVYKTASEGFQLIFTIRHQNYDIRTLEPAIEYRAEGLGQWKKMDEQLVTRTDDESDPTTGYIAISLPKEVTQKGGIGDYEFRCTYKLFEQWEYSTSEVAVVRFDANEPQVDAVYDLNAVKTSKDKVKFFNEKQTVTIQVTEKNFDAEDVLLKVMYRPTAADNWVEKEMGIRNKNWIHGLNHIHILHLPFEEEGHYKLQISCTDMLNISSTKNIADEFVIDLHDPSVPSIEYRESFNWVDILGELFGFPLADENKQVTATLSAKDAVSGIEFMEVSINGRDFEKISANSDGTFTYTMNEGFRNQLTVKAHDGSTRFSSYAEQGTIVVDTVSPVIEVEHSANHKQYADDPAIYTNADSFPIHFLVKDENYDLRGENAVVLVNGISRELVWADDLVDEQPCGRSALLLENEGVYTVSAEFTDRSGNADAWSRDVIVDRTEPVIDVDFADGQNRLRDGIPYYKTAQTITVTITESSFLPEFAMVKLTRAGENLPLESTWSTEGNKHILTLLVEDDGEYVLTANCSDKAGNVSKHVEIKFFLDQIQPEINILSHTKSAVAKTLEELTWGFIDAPVTVKIQATDTFTGVETIHYRLEGTKGMNSTDEVKLEGYAVPDQNGYIDFEINQAFCGTVTAWALDFANNKSTEVNVLRDFNDNINHVIVLDNDVTIRNVQMNDPVRIVALEGMTDCDGYEERDEKVLYFNTDAKIGIELTEDNFFPEKYQVYVNGDEQSVEWTSDGVKHMSELVFDADGDYVVRVSGADYSGNQMNEYISQRIVVDKTPPVVNVNYSVNGVTTDAEALDGAFLDSAVTAHIEIREHNFRAENVQILVTARNSAGANVLDTDEEGIVNFYLEQGHSQYVNDESDERKEKWTSFTDDMWRREDDTYVIDLVFNCDASYTFQVQYEDLATHIAETQKIGFTVDNKDPVIEIVGISRDVQYTNALEKTLTFKILEENFTPSGIVFDVNAVNAKGETVNFAPADLSWEPNEDRNQWTASLVLTDEANYEVKLSYTDPSGRIGVLSGTSEQTEFVGYLTIDRTSPENVILGCCEEETHYHQESTVLTVETTDITAGIEKFRITLIPNMEFPAATTWDVTQNEHWTLDIPWDVDIQKWNSEALDRGLMAEITEFNNDGGFTRLILKLQSNFCGDVRFEAIDLAGNTAPIQILERLIVDNVTPVCDARLPDAVTVTDDRVRYYGSDSVEAKFTLTEANLANKEELVFTVNGEETALDWSSDVDNQNHLASYTMKDEGHYVLQLSYIDPSGNVMDTYTSETIVIDRTVPVIDVEYSQEMDAVAVYEYRDYYSVARTAVITVTERNFDPEDVKLMVTAKDADEIDVAEGVTMSGWDSAGDVHTIVLSYSNDANYTFDVSYTDKSGNAAAEYAEEKFTVDKTNPGITTIRYDTSVLEAILNEISFGFYDAQITVHLESEDTTAGIEEFVYSYVTASNVSNVNSGKTDQKVLAVRNGSKANASFQIPQSELKDGTQFNGTVTVTAVDRSNNRTTTQDSKRIVVDNISPTASISYNNPSQTANGTAYYSDKIDVSIRITEANFYSSDVVVNVIRDGVNCPVNVFWSDQSRDLHTGTFTLNKEGDYVVEIKYTDKSGNSMAHYKSGKMVIDQVAPVIRVDNVIANSANDGDVYAFTITVDDADGNLMGSAVHPVLTAVVRDENGRHITEEISLGDPAVVAAGKTHVYTVENLVQDAIYTLSCDASDLARNSTDMMILDDGLSYKTVRFSVNRNGSTFMFGNEQTSDLTSQYYVQNVEHDVVIHEVNVDQITNFSVTVSGVELTAGVDYTTTVSGSDSEWCSREYIIPASYFAEEGEYNIVVSSVDATSTTAYSDLKGLSMTFCVDRTEPSIVVGGLEEGGRYETAEQTVKLLPSDDGGSLGQIKILLYEDGADIDRDKPSLVIFEMEGDELLNYLESNSGEITFTIPEGYQQTVVIVCADQSVGSDGTSNTYTKVFRKVTVSSDSLVIFFANKQVFYSTVAGVLALAAILIGLYLKYRKKQKRAATGSVNV